MLKQNERSRFLAREKRLERRNGFRRAHPLAEQMALVVDPADQVFRRVLEKLARGRDRLSGKGGNFARHLARFGFEMIRLDDWGYPIIDPRVVPPELMDFARRAVAACPTLALALVGL